MVAWIASQTRPDNPQWDYYLKTQVQGEKVDIPHLTADMLMNIKLGERLRGSEADRIAAASGFKNLVEKLGPEFPGMKDVAFILRDSKQDYAAALAKIREIEKLVANSEKGNVLLNFGGHFRHMGKTGRCDIWVIDPDGRETEAKIDFRPNYQSEGNKAWSIVQGDCLVLCWYCGPGSESWEVVRLPKGGATYAQREVVKAIEPHDRFYGPGSGFDLSQVGMNTCESQIEAEHFYVKSRGAKPVPRSLKEIVVGADSKKNKKSEAPVLELEEGDDPKSTEDLVKAMNSKWNKF